MESKESNKNSFAYKIGYFIGNFLLAAICAVVVITVMWALFNFVKWLF